MTRQSMPLPLQLPLGVSLRVDTSFENFVPGPNAPLLEVLRSVGLGDGERYIYLWGTRGSGKSHLLQGLCQEMAARQVTCGYLPLAMTGEFLPDVLDGLETLDVVCLDDLDAVAGDAAWEQALFNFFNRMKETGHTLVVAANNSPNGLGLQLADLRSRLNSGLVWQLDMLDDDMKIAALQVQAKQRGLVLESEVGRFLLRRCPRDMGSLFALLERLDQASLAAQRRLTIPFVKKVLRS